VDEAFDTSFEVRFPKIQQTPGDRRKIVMFINYSVPTVSPFHNSSDWAARRSTKYLFQFALSDGTEHRKKSRTVSTEVTV
jgi:hypothetical protein